MPRFDDFGAIVAKLAAPKVEAGADPRTAIEESMREVLEAQRKQLDGIRGEYVDGQGYRDTPRAKAATRTIARGVWNAVRKSA